MEPADVVDVLIDALQALKAQRPPRDSAVVDGAASETTEVTP